MKISFRNPLEMLQKFQKKVCIISHAGISTANIATKPLRWESIWNVALELCLGFEQSQVNFLVRRTNPKKGEKAAGATEWLSLASLNTLMCV